MVTLNGKTSIENIDAFEANSISTNTLKSSSITGGLAQLSTVYSTTVNSNIINSNIINAVGIFSGNVDTDLLEVGEITGQQKNENNVNIKVKNLDINAKGEISLNAEAAIGLTTTVDLSLTAGGTISANSAINLTMEAAENVSIRSVALMGITCGGELTISATEAITITSGAAATITAVGNVGIIAANFNVSSGEIVNILAGTDVSIDGAESVNITSAAEIGLTVEENAVVVNSVGASLVAGDDGIAVTPEGVEINSGETTIAMAPEAITMSSVGDIEINSETGINLTCGENAIALTDASMSVAADAISFTAATATVTGDLTVTGIVICEGTVKCDRIGNPAGVAFSLPNDAPTIDFQLTGTGATTTEWRRARALVADHGQITISNTDEPIIIPSDKVQADSIIIITPHCFDITPAESFTIYPRQYYANTSVFNWIVINK